MSKLKEILLDVINIVAMALVIALMLYFSLPGEV